MQNTRRAGASTSRSRVLPELLPKKCIAQSVGPTPEVQAALQREERVVTQLIAAQRLDESLAQHVHRMAGTTKSSRLAAKKRAEKLVRIRAARPGILHMSERSKWKLLASTSGVSHEYPAAWGNTRRGSITAFPGPAVDARPTSAWAMPSKVRVGLGQARLKAGQAVGTPPAAPACAEPPVPALTSPVRRRTRKRKTASRSTRSSMVSTTTKGRGLLQQQQQQQQRRPRRSTTASTKPKRIKQPTSQGAAAQADPATPTRATKGRARPAKQHSGVCITPVRGQHHPYDASWGGVLQDVDTVGRDHLDKWLAKEQAKRREWLCRFDQDRAPAVRRVGSFSSMPARAGRLDDQSQAALEAYVVAYDRSIRGCARAPASLQTTSESVLGVGVPTPAWE